MNNTTCRNCGSELHSDICDKCGYNHNLTNTFKNIITNKKAKEDVGDNTLAYLVNTKLITKNDFKGLIIEFGYLFLDNNNSYCSLLKVIIPKKLLKSERTFYIAIQNKQIILLDNNFNDTLFKKTSTDMLTMHKVDQNKINKNDYLMQLN